MIQYATKPVPHEEARDLIKGKATVTREVFEGLPDELRARAFVVTGIEGFDMLQELRDRIADLPAGADWNEVKSDVANGLSPWLGRVEAEKRAQILMRHHGFSAYAATQAKVQDELIETFPFRQYISTDDFAVRASHAALHGIILPANHSFWEKHTPPWEWNCRCDVVELTEIDMEEELARDKRRNPENRRVLGEVEQRQLATGTLSRGPSVNVDVRTPKERGGNYENNVRDLTLPYSEIRKRWNGQTRKEFEEWASTVGAGTDGVTELSLYEWLTGERPRVAARQLKKSAPVGKPKVSDAIKVLYRGAKHRAMIARGLDAIDAVHDDGVLPSLPIRGRSGALGHYSFSQRDRHIAIRSTGSWPGMTTIHEVGHFIDHMGFGTGEDGIAAFGSEQVGGRLAKVIEKIKQGETWVDLHSFGTDYFRRPHELWARAYAQYITTRSGDKTLKGELDKIRKSPQPWRQWPDEEFEGIAKAIDELMEELGWK